MQDLNVGGKLEKMKSLLDSWHARGLTLQGKIMVLKALGISVLTYPLINLHVPKTLLEKVDKECFKYIWGSQKKTKIKRKVLIQDYCDGGLKAPDIFTMYKTWKLSWIERLQCEESGKWKVIFLSSLEKLGGLDYLLACNFSIEKINIKLMDFWKDVLSVYAEIHEVDPKTKDQVREQIINNNKYVVIGGKSFYSKELAQKGMDQVGDWFDVQGTKLNPLLG